MKKTTYQKIKELIDDKQICDYISFVLSVKKNASFKASRILQEINEISKKRGINVKIDRCILNFAIFSYCGMVKRDVPIKEKYQDCNNEIKRLFKIKIKNINEIKKIIRNKYTNINQITIYNIILYYVAYYNIDPTFIKKKRISYTINKEELQRLYNRNCIKSIAEILGMPSQFLTKKIKELKIDKTKRKPLQFRMKIYKPFTYYIKCD